MANWKLLMHWLYSYDKEGVWDDDEEGKSEFALEEGATYDVPNLERRKQIEILSLKEENGIAVAQVKIDYHVYTLTSGEEAAKGSCSYSYSVCGDSVHISVSFSLELARTD